MTIEKAHLYVEKYSKIQQEILLDFVREDEFLYFKNYGDYTENMHLSESGYEPTMLLLHGCVPMRKLYEGAMITVNMDKLLTLRREMRDFRYNVEDRNQNQPAVVYFEVSDGEGFAELIDDQESSVSSYIRKEFIYTLDSSWDGPPCALDRMDDSFKLCIWNVGQGNTNSIFDQSHLALFDFGASIYYSKHQLERIYCDHIPPFEDKFQISMIISHWDCDHYNLLCVADDVFLKKLCCVYYPPTIITLTAKQIAARIRKCCRYRVAIPPARHTPSRQCGIHTVYEGEQYTLFTGASHGNPHKSGLLLAVYSKTATAFLTADHSNYQVWDQMYNYNGYMGRNNKTLHIVVPHHGGNCGKPTVQRAALPGTAVVSVGSNNYHHPHPATLAAYRCANYNLVRTDRMESDMIICMQ